jgi:hypothetical protein
MSDTTDPFVEWDAAYVLGMLSPDERRTFERHLATCDACRSAVTELAGMPGILGTLSSAEATALENLADDTHLSEEAHQPGQVQALARVAARRRRTSRRRTGGIGIGLAALGVVAGILFGTSVIAPANPTGSVVQTSSPSAEAPMTQVTPGVMTADLTITSKDWGTRFDWTCHYVDGAWTGGASAPSYDLVVTDKSGHQTTVATWTASGATAANLSASTGLRVGDIRSVEIRPAGSQTTLVKTAL